MERSSNITVMEVMTMIELLADFFHYDFMWKALLIGVMISASTSVLGVYLVLEKMSLIGDGLAHASFGGIALGFLFNVDPVLTAFAVAGIASFGINHLVTKERTHGDSAIALALSTGMALAVVIIGVVGGFNADLFSYLFGSILSISFNDIILTFVVSGGVVGFFVFKYDSILQMNFNEELAELNGVNTKRTKYVLTFLVALSVVTAVRAVGILLVTGLIVIPPLTALQIAKSYKNAVFLSFLVSMSGMFVGVFSSFALDIPPSGAIILSLILLFGISTLISEKEK